MSSDTRRLLVAGILGATLPLLAACTKTEPGTSKSSVAATRDSAQRAPGTALTLHDTTITGTFDASGIAQPLQQASLSTKLMGTVLDVQVREGESVRRGQALLHIDDRELAAKANQLSASVAEAEAMQRDATTQVQRMRALYADSAATKAQLDAAELGLVRAAAAVRTVNASAAELEVSRSYATVNAPFSGVVSRRFADPGTFATPGMPLVTIDDISSLRIAATVAANAAASLKRGQTIDASIDGRPTKARIEGIVSADAGNLYTVNAVTVNTNGVFRAGGSAILHIPGASRATVLVPARAIVRDGDLTGVVVRTAARDERRWIRLGSAVGAQVEITGGVVAGETIVVPPSTSSSGSIKPEN